MDQLDERVRPAKSGPAKSPDAFSTISEVSEKLDIPQHVLRFWETKFPQIKPLKRGGGRRYYRPDDVELLMAIRALLHVQGYTIRGVQKLFKEQGLKAVLALGHGHGSPTLPPAESAPANAPQPAVNAAPVPTPLPPQPVNLAAAAVVEGALLELAEIRDLLLKSAGS